MLMEEILPKVIGSLSHYLHGSWHPRWWAGFFPSTVSQPERPNQTMWFTVASMILLANNTRFWMAFSSPIFCCSFAAKLDLYSNSPTKSHKISRIPFIPWIFFSEIPPKNLGCHGGMSRSHHVSISSRENSKKIPGLPWWFRDLLEQRLAQCRGLETHPRMEGFRSIAG